MFTLPLRQAATLLAILLVAAIAAAGRSGDTSSYGRESIARQIRATLEEGRAGERNSGDYEGKRDRAVRVRSEAVYVTVKSPRRRRHRGVGVIAGSSAVGGVIGGQVGKVSGKVAGAAVGLGVGVKDALTIAKQLLTLGER